MNIEISKDKVSGKLSICETERTEKSYHTLIEYWIYSDKETADKKWAELCSEQAQTHWQNRTDGFRKINEIFNKKS